MFDQPFALRRSPAALLVCLVALSLVGCGKDGAKRQEAQVAARVNDQDITIHQVQHAVQRMLPGRPAQGEAAVRRALDQLIEQEVSAQAAREQGLDKEPAVIQALEAARREVLARAWQDRLAATATGPSTDEVDRYYAEHPALFAQRRLYLLQESLVEVRSEDERARAERIVRDAQSVRELEDKLGAAGLSPRSRQFAQAAEDLPMALVEPIGALEAGRSILLPAAEGVRAYTVLQATPAPVSRRFAQDPIGAFLLADRKRLAVANAMKPIREKARVEYRGSFASAASAATNAR